MSDIHNNHKHAALIKTPKQLVAVILAAFIIPIVVIVLLVTYVVNGNQVGVGGEQTDLAIRQRIAPVASYELRDINAPRVYKSGQEVYQQICAVCHTAGVAGAPKFANVADWSARLTLGIKKLHESVIKGKNAMPARAGASPDDVSDYELERALVYLVNASGGQFAEPVEPAPVESVPAAGSK
jgi:cytochrome c5